MIRNLRDYILNLHRRGAQVTLHWGQRLVSHGRNLGHWINSNRTDLLHIFTTIVVALLLLGMINQVNVSRKSSQSNNQLIRGETTIIKNQSKQIVEQKAEIAALSSHVDCLFILASNPQQSTAYIANPASCLIAAPAAHSTSSASPAPTSIPTSTKTNSGQTGATTPDSQGNNSNPADQNCTAKILFACL